MKYNFGIPKRNRNIHYIRDMHELTPHPEMHYVYVLKEKKTNRLYPPSQKTTGLPVDVMPKADAPLAQMRKMMLRRMFTERQA